MLRLANWGDTSHTIPPPLRGRGLRGGGGIEPPGGGSSPEQAERRSSQGQEAEREQHKVLTELLAFFADRLKVQLKEEGLRPDVIDAVFAAGDDDLLRVRLRAQAVQAFLATDDGDNLLSAYTRIRGVLAKEKYAQDFSEFSDSVSEAEETMALYAALLERKVLISEAQKNEEYQNAMSLFGELRPYVDRFFDEVLVVDKEDVEGTKNRLHLLNRLAQTMDMVARFSEIQQKSVAQKNAA